MRQVRVVYANVFLIRLKKENAGDWPARLEMVVPAMRDSKYKTDITVWADVRPLLGGDFGLSLYVTPFRPHYYSRLRERLKAIPGYDHDEYGRHDTVPTEEARPVLGISKNQLLRYLAPVWWRGSVFATIRTVWGAAGIVPEEMDYLIKVPLTEATSAFRSETAHHCLFELVRTKTKR